MSENENQLITFFLYSLVIHPIANYIISPKRKYPRWRGILYTIIFLLSVSILHHILDSWEDPPNYYQLLKLTRNFSPSQLKKSYRSLSLEYHPDKNKSANASKIFQQIKEAYDVLNNKELRSIYDNIGINTVKSVANGSLLTERVILIQLLISYSSSFLYLFFLTLSRSNENSFYFSFFGLLFLFWLESGFQLFNFTLPSSIFPSYPPSELISFLHRLFPSIINLICCICDSNEAKDKEDEVKFLQYYYQNMTNIYNKIIKIFNITHYNLVKEINLIELNKVHSMSTSNDSSSSNKDLQSNQGIISQSLHNIKVKLLTINNDEKIARSLKETIEILMNKHLEDVKNIDNFNKAIDSNKLNDKNNQYNKNDNDNINIKYQIINFLKGLLLYLLLRYIYTTFHY